MQTPVSEMFSMLPLMPTPSNRPVSAMAVVLWVGGGGSDAWLHYSALTKLWRLSALVVAGVATYFAVLWALGFRLKDFTRRTIE